MKRSFTADLRVQVDFSAANSFVAKRMAGAIQDDLTTRIPRLVPDGQARAMDYRVVENTAADWQVVITDSASERRFEQVMKRQGAQRTRRREFSEVGAFALGALLTAAGAVDGEVFPLFAGILGTVVLVVYLIREEIDGLARALAADPQA